MVVISNGFNKFHLAVAAAEMERRGMLSAFMTGAYPTRKLAKLLSLTRIDHSKKMGRLLARAELIDPDHVFSDLLSEGIHAVGRYVNGANLRKVAEVLDLYSMRRYGDWASRVLQQRKLNGAAVYHYRAGFGHTSVRAAKAAGMITLCDHSIAHPRLVDYMVGNGGRLPNPGVSVRASMFWEEVLGDIQQADALLVNSDFVRSTFVHQGWPAEKIHVIYWGVDDAFLDGIPTSNAGNGRQSRSHRIVFAGSFEERKGGRELHDAFERLIASGVAIDLDIAGGIASTARGRIARLREMSNVTYHGILSRPALAGLLTEADIFVFPSLVEGSARVVFEALACGCYVITTPNSGSIVQDGVHGRIIPPGDSDALASAVAEAVALGREKLKIIGRQNATLVRENYRQTHYGEQLLELYVRLTNGAQVPGKMGERRADEFA